jgi:hypothetical protein
MVPARAMPGPVRSGELDLLHTDGVTLATRLWGDHPRSFNPVGGAAYLPPCNVAPIRR